MSGGAAEMLSSRYACRVFAGMEVMSECRASGVGGTAGVGECEDPGGRVIAIVGCCRPSPLNAASEGEGVRSC